MVLSKNVGNQVFIVVQRSYIAYIYRSYTRLTYCLLHCNIQSVSTRTVTNYYYQYKTKQTKFLYVNACYIIRLKHSALCLMLKINNSASPRYLLKIKHCASCFNLSLKSRCSRSKISPRVICAQFPRALCAGAKSHV